MRFSLCVARSELSRFVVDVSLDESGGFSKLSVCGSESVRASAGKPWRDSSGGQIDLPALVERIATEPGAEVWPHAARLAEVWDRWHLNDMRAGCEHQTGPDWDTSKTVEHVSYSIDWDDRRALQRIEEREARALGLEVEESTGRRPFGSPAQARGPLTPTQAGDFQKFSAAAALLATLKRAGVEPFAWRAVRGRAEALLLAQFQPVQEYELKAYRAAVQRHNAGEGVRWGGKFFGQFSTMKPPILRRVEKKALGWLSPEEHPAGLLCKPCPVCGYKYGSEWRREVIPADVLAEIATWKPAAQPATAEDENARDLGVSLVSCRRLNPTRSGWPADASHFVVTLRGPGGEAEFKFSQGSAHKEPPTAARVLECLLADAEYAGLTDDELHEELGLKPSQIREVRDSQEKFARMMGTPAVA